MTGCRRGSGFARRAAASGVAGVGRWSMALLALLACASAGAVARHATPTSCRRARAWVTHKSSSGAFESTWVVPDCGHDVRAPDDTITVDLSKRDQQMLGFGAALTGGSAWLLATRMHPRQRARLLRELFAPPPTGIGLSLLRLPVGSSDLSRRRYSLAPTPPKDGRDRLKLELAPMQQTTLPVLREALQIQPTLRVIASPWSPPAWMKTSDSLIGGRLLPAREADFTRYLVEFVEIMQRSGIPIFALTLQNEPDYRPGDYPGMLMDEPQQARIIADDLGPALAQHRLKTRILGWDDNWDQFEQPLALLANPQAAKYVAGIAWHCYLGQPGAQDLVHQRYPAKWQLVTECSDGTWQPNDHDSIADFASNSLIDPVRHWSAGTILWGLALDELQGPHDGGCNECIGVVTIDRHSGRAKPTRDYYALAHFSAFIKPGAYRVASSDPVDGLDNVSFVDTQSHVVTIVLANRKADSRRVRIVVGEYHMVLDVPGRGLATAQMDSVEM